MGQKDNENKKEIMSDKEVIRNQTWGKEGSMLKIARWESSSQADPIRQRFVC